MQGHVRHNQPSPGGTSTTPPRAPASRLLPANAHTHVHSPTSAGSLFNRSLRNYLCSLELSLLVSSNQHVGIKPPAAQGKHIPAGALKRSGRQAGRAAPRGGRSPRRGQASCPSSTALPARSLEGGSRTSQAAGTGTGSFTRQLYSQVSCIKAEPNRHTQDRDLPPPLSAHQGCLYCSLPLCILKLFP